ncbi:hypothetical protein [Oricola indica]|jgi:hypothetical protein|uniref:hypothetical protein n=1 Tax=Oricola indica TaxID=2872591 RepID=UPI001CBF1116|nr:hypothetical protein [Oricola indica]
MTLTFLTPDQCEHDPAPFSIPTDPDDRKHVGYFDLPYGLWTGHNGAEVLFNRQYDALWGRFPGFPASRMKARHWSAIFPETPMVEEWFYDDATSPRANDRQWERAEKCLLAFLTGRDVRGFLVDCA